MILKITKQNQFDNGKEGYTEYIEEFYESKSFVIKNGNAEPFEKNMLIPITDYEFLDEMLGGSVYCKVLSVYLMNNEGKTIEKIN